jgi:carbamoylphosphate synthase large subunit
MNRDQGKRRAFICLAAGKSQIVVIRKVKEMGFAVIAVDRNPEAPGFQLADERIIASTYEVAPILSKLRQLSDCYTLSGVVNRSSGPPVVTAAELSKGLGLPGTAPDVARQVVDKERLKEAFRESNVRVPTGQTISDSEEISEECLGFPCVVRPVLSSIGKSGVQVVRERAVLPQAIKRAGAVSFNGRVMVEEFIHGNNFSLYGFVLDGELQPLILIDELNGIDPDGRVKGVGMAVPSLFRCTEEGRRIEAAAHDVVARIGIGTSVCYMSFRCPAGGWPTLIEIHLDLGADLILEELLPASSDFDFMAYFIRGLTGDQQPPPRVSLRPVALLYGERKDAASERSSRLLWAGTREELDRMILGETGDIYA